MDIISEYLEIARHCEKYEEYDIALKYYKLILEEKPNLQTALVGVQRARNELAKIVYFRSPANSRLVEGELQLRKGLLVFVPNCGSEDEYELDRISNYRVRLGRLEFVYNGMISVCYSCRYAKKWEKILRDTEEGIYPKGTQVGLTALEQYIDENFSRESMEDAIQYFMEMSGCKSQEARIVVRRILG